MRSNESGARRRMKRVKSKDTGGQEQGTKSRDKIKETKVRGKETTAWRLKLKDC